ncbi:hypothetical protein S40285_08863 [Stachybotrys chlorohalonatus IBT 40285]|uniref:AB hydrolase-1 domain-containing protein n=1 Tax=Stachybotrys chlorohalonatus (strain IBT 40285) TaxID=1283841 RepID=A0A084R346_STAC4|nr:hypothetical protein S40285_08863 [Stachybotrys chlorohalonata IBT 40285]
MILAAAALVAFAPLVIAQGPSAAVHSTGFNSSFTLTPAQIAAAQLDDALVQRIQTIVNFDRTQLASGGPREDDFYRLPPLANNTGLLAPGLLLKLQAFTDSTAYALPPSTALSRILYTTRNFNGTVIPTSGFVLWPFTPRRSPAACANATDAGKVPVVVWTHGTSGFFASQAPSAHRGLWYSYSAPFALVQAGYAVFAPDYAGLGVATSWDGSEIPHQYHASPATARDALYGLRAARQAFPLQLSTKFVAMGHSQGGGAAWSVSEALASDEDEFADLVAGFRGAVAVSPTTDVFSGSIEFFMLPTFGVMLHSIFPSFKLEDWLTPLGAARTRLAREIDGGISVLVELHTSSGATWRSDWNESWYGDAFATLGNAGHRDFRGPLLVVQGTEDVRVQYNVTSRTVRDMWRLQPQRDLEFLVAQGVGHNPVLEATQHVWTQWIHDRLEARPLQRPGSVRTELDSFVPADQYLSVGNSFLLWAGLPEFSYEVALSV